MEPIIEPADFYCATKRYLLTAQNCDDGLYGEWIASANGVTNASSVIFDSPNNPVTYVTAPAEGIFFYQFKCCKAA